MRTEALLMLLGTGVVLGADQIYEVFSTDNACSQPVTVRTYLNEKCYTTDSGQYESSIRYSCTTISNENYIQRENWDTNACAGTATTTGVFGRGQSNCTIDVRSGLYRYWTCTKPTVGFTGSWGWSHTFEEGPCAESKIKFEAAVMYKTEGECYVDPTASTPNNRVYKKFTCQTSEPCGNAPEGVQPDCPAYKEETCTDNTCGTCNSLFFMRFIEKCKQNNEDPSVNDLTHVASGCAATWNDMPLIGAEPPHPYPNGQSNGDGSGDGGSEGDGSNGDSALGEDDHASRANSNSLLMLVAVSLSALAISHSALW